MTGTNYTVCVKSKFIWLFNRVHICCVRIVGIAVLEGNHFNGFVPYEI